MPDTIFFLTLVAVCFLIALAALVGAALLVPERRPGLVPAGRRDKARPVFLFDDDVLVDATPPARRMLSASEGGSDWERLVALLEPLFPGLGALPARALEEGEAEIESVDRTSRIRGQLLRGRLRLELCETEESGEAPAFDRHALAALDHEVQTHRAVASALSSLIWRENAAGQIVWANRAYLDAAEIMSADAEVAAWPPACLFPQLVPGEEPRGERRATLEIPGESAPKWFRIERTALGEDTLFVATPIDDLVRAENSLSEFVSTLTATFAHLPTGLAIFDHERRLSLFNPALTDLTMLPAGFLAGKPTLFAFLDALREKRMIPEPRDYRSWRQNMADLERRAVNGSYCETWCLPTGQTYRVIGQPHPGGAVAFLFEDISAEMSLSRRFHAELEMGQAALDNMRDAIAVFTAGGVIAMTNRAYRELWGQSADSSVSDMTVSDATSVWGRACNPTPVWRQLHAFVDGEGERSRWQAPVTLKDGRVIRCAVSPMPQGATMVTFSPPAQEIPAPPREVPSAAASS